MEDDGRQGKNAEDEGRREESTQLGNAEAEAGGRRSVHKHWAGRAGLRVLHANRIQDF